MLGYHPGKLLILSVVSENIHGQKSSEEKPPE
jgi:hypothetical protein